MVDKDFNLKLIDFGTSRRINEEITISSDESDENENIEKRLRPVSRRDSFVGTTNYLAPEMADEGRRKECSYSVDLWAFGCIVFKMITGKIAFPGTNMLLVQ